MRAVVGQFLGQRENVIVFLRPHQIAEVLHPRRGVQFFGHDQRLRFQIQGHGGVSTRRRSSGLHIPFGRLRSGNRLHHGLQVLRRRPAAPAHNPHAIVRHKVPVIVRQFFRRQLINRPSTFVLWQARIRQHGNVLRGIQPQIANRIVHLHRAGGAVQPQNVDVVRLQRRVRRPNLGAQQHGSRRFQGDLHLHWKPLASLLHGIGYACQRRFRLQ